MKLKEEEQAYHGTSHYFKAFRTAGIGGGAGGQAYGWGLYFAKSKDFAKNFGESVWTSKGKPQKLLFGGKTPEELGMQYECEVFFGLPRNLKTAEQLIDWAEEMIEIFKEEDIIHYQHRIEEYEKFIGVIQKLEVNFENMFYVYSVILHKGKSPFDYEYLDWDKHSTPQSQVDKINRQALKEGVDLKVDTKISGSKIYANIESAFADTKNKSKEASLFLLRAGIDGNTHDSGNVRILFDEKAITIKEIEKIKNPGKLSEIRIINKIKPFAQNDRGWFYFRDQKDGDDYHNFYYNGYYLANFESFSVAYPKDDDGKIEMKLAMNFLKRNNILFELNKDKYSPEIKFDANYVNFDGFTKTIDTK